MKHLVLVAVAAAALAGCSAAEAEPSPAPAATGPDYAGFVAAVGDIPFANGPYSAREGLCTLKERPDMTRAEALEFVATTMPYIGRGRAEAERSLDAIDRYNMCPAGDWEHS